MIYYLAIAIITTAVFIVIGLFSNPENKQSRVWVNGIYSSLSGLVIYLCFWFSHAIISPQFTGWMWLVAVLFAIRVIIAASDEHKETFNWWYLLFFIPIFGLISLEIYSSKAVNAEEYRNVIIVEVVEYEKAVDELTPIPLDKLATVNIIAAEKKAGTLLSDIPGLGSKCEIGRMDISKLNGSFTITDGKGDEHHLTFENEQVWTAPLVFKTRRKFKKYKETEGFVLVSATNINRCYLITKVNGVDMKLKYLEDGYFDFNLERHLRKNGYIGTGLTDFSMIPNDNCFPFYVATKYKKLIGVGGKIATGTVILNPITGEINEFDVENTPKWVENIQPLSFVSNYIKDWGDLVHGWYNPSDMDKVKPTSGMGVVMDDNAMYYYTGIQSYGSDEGTSGFLLVNTRDLTSTFYRISGINEDGAMRAFSNNIKVKDKNYNVSFPKPYKVRGIPSYISTFSGDDGKVELYGFCSIKNEKSMGIARTLVEAVNEYQKSLIINQQELNIGDNGKVETVELTVLDVTREGQDYFVLVEENKKLELRGSSISFKEIKWLKKGDKIKVNYNLGEGETSAAISSLDLLRLDL